MSNITIKESTLEEISKIHKQIPEFDLDYIEENAGDRLVPDNSPLLVIGLLDNIPVGYLVAYKRDNDRSYYCWLAGVIPQYRNKKVLSEMMNYLQKYAKSKGFESVTIKTQNRFKNMLLYLNKNGFEIVSTIPNNGISRTEILLRKKL